MKHLNFRVWDEEQKKMYPASILQNGYSADYIYTDFETGEVELLLNPNDYPIMQSTGVHDKNGNLIYEGDIFPCVYAFDGCIDHNMVVEWDENDAKFYLKYEGCHQKYVEKRISDLKRLEIIGNKFRNPELL